MKLLGGLHCSVVVDPIGVVSYMCACVRMSKLFQVALMQCSCNFPASC